VERSGRMAVIVAGKEFEQQADNDVCGPSHAYVLGMMRT
jgi:hypothetical protein